MFYFSQLLTYYFFYSALGWLIESIYCSLGERKWINRGFLTGPICPIYGAGAMVMIVILVPLSKLSLNYTVFEKTVSFTPLLVCVVGMAVSDLVEFITSYVMEKLFHARWWDYSNKPFNIQGRICLQHTIYWGVFSLIFVYLVHPFVSGFAERIFPHDNPQKLYIVLAIMLIIFAIDVANAVRNAMDVRKVMDKVRKLSERMTKVANDLKNNVDITFDNIQTSTTRRAERFAEWRTDISEQLGDLFAFMGDQKDDNATLSQKGKKRINRLISVYPNFRKRAKKQLTTLEELLAEIKSRITDEDEEMY